MSNNLTKVFCLGLSRTGTTALSHALDNLGIPTLHYSLEAFVQKSKIDGIAFQPQLKLSNFKSWLLKKEIKAKQVEDFDGVFENYRCFTDLPFPMMYKVLHEKHPDAKFIYTYRDEKKWLKSMKWLYNDAAVIWKHGWLDNEIMQWAYGTNVYSEEKLIKVYKAHHKEVNSYFENSANFISLNIDNGELHYKNLTTFLGLPLIDKPVERINAPQIPTDLERRLYWITKNNDFIGFLNLIKRKCI